MDIFCIRGGTPLHGRIALHGAKNAALPLLAATLATGARCELLDCPDISDVTAACAILRHLGCAVEQHGGIVAVDAGSACRSDIPAELMRKMRAAVLFLGPLLARFGTAELSLPGGCVLGARPIDLRRAYFGPDRRPSRLHGRAAASKRRRNGESDSCGARLPGNTDAVQRRA